LNIAELTGDMSITKSEIAETHIIVATPEKWDVVTRKTDGMMDRVNCLIIDEIHLLNDERGLVLECLVARAITTGLKNQKPIRIVGLSATLPNYNDVAEFIGADEKGTFYFDSSYRPTPLKCGFYGIKETTNMKRANNIMNDIIYTNLKRMLRLGKQAIIFAHKRGETYSTALEMIDIIKEKSGDSLLFECEDSWKVKKEVDKSTNQQIKDLFPYGFGIHHAGMLRKDRNLVEKLFSEGHIKVLCSTATLAWGVNLPAYGVLIKGTKVYDSNAGGYKDVGIFDVQ
jgi:replicative superfamily II helicase